MAVKGSKMSEETKKKISIANKGKKRKPQSLESIQKRVESRKGYKHSEETKRKISESNKISCNKSEFKARYIGDANPAKQPGVGEKISVAKTGCKYSDESKKHISAALTGRNLSDEHKQHISEALRRRTPELYEKVAEKISGPNHWNWQGGISKEVYCEKWTPELRRRIRAFFDYKCILCGKSEEENNQALSCHHVYYNKSACCDDNDRIHFAALCRSCHGKTGKKNDHDRWSYILQRIIEEIYNNKSYYTREEYIKILSL